MKTNKMPAALVDKASTVCLYRVWTVIDSRPSLSSVPFLGSSSDAGNFVGIYGAYAIRFVSRESKTGRSYLVSDFEAVCFVCGQSMTGS